VSITIKVGDTIAAMSGSVLYRDHGWCEVVGLTDQYVWLKDAEGAHLQVLRSIAGSLWRKLTPFFQIGKEYRFPNRDATWEILDIYEVDKPRYGHALKAIARLSDGGLEDIQTLNSDDFERMEEV